MVVTLETRQYSEGDSVDHRLRTNDHHHRVAAKVVSKIERGRSATSVHGFVLAVFRARARARSRTQLYHSIPVNALLGQEFGNGGNE
jgi:hypothetical protein